MFRKIISVAKEAVRKNIITALVTSLLIGGGIGLFVAGKRSTPECFSGIVSGLDTSPSGKIVVDISGAVNKPGVYELEAGARVGDLINRGGGVKGDSSVDWVSKNINLSKKLDDSSKLYIPFDWEIYEPEKYGLLAVTAPVSSSTTSNNSNTNSNSEETGNSTNNIGKINVNTATSSELDSLTGIGPAYAEKIIASRPYKDLEDFETRSGLWQSTISGIQNLISF